MYQCQAAHRGFCELPSTCPRFLRMSAVSWSEDIYQANLCENWPFHVLELHKAIEQVVDFINVFDVAWANKLPDPVWIPITTGRPQAAVMQQLQTIILGL